MREKLIELLCPHMQHDGCELFCKRPPYCNSVIEAADDLIENGVTAHKKGEWDDSGRYQFMDGTKAIRCTECGCALTEIEYKKYFYNFCPVCGADMRPDAPKDGDK